MPGCHGLAKGLARQDGKGTLAGYQRPGAVRFGWMEMFSRRPAVLAECIAAGSEPMAWAGPWPRDQLTNVGVSSGAVQFHHSARNEPRSRRWWHSCAPDLLFTTGQALLGQRRRAPGRPHVSAAPQRPPAPAPSRPVQPPPAKPAASSRTKPPPSRPGRQLPPSRPGRHRRQAVVMRFT